jgi:hypothetical protein
MKTMEGRLSGIFSSIISGGSGSNGSKVIIGGLCPANLVSGMGTVGDFFKGGGVVCTWVFLGIAQAPRLIAQNRRNTYQAIFFIVAITLLSESIDGRLEPYLSLSATVCQNG